MSSDARPYGGRIFTILFSLGIVLSGTGCAIYLNRLISNVEQGTVVALIQAATGINVILLINILVLSITLLVLTLFITTHRARRREKAFIEMKSDFIAIASHELRTPLASIRWSLAGLKASTGLSEEVRKVVDDIYLRTIGLIELTGTFLQSTAADHGAVQRRNDLFEIGQLVHESVQHLQASALMKKISIQLDPSLETRVSMRGDKQRLRLVFDNLISNAIKYSRENSIISLRFFDENARKIFTFTDQGMGIPATEIKDVFTGFRRASNAEHSGKEGTGFGLYMVKNIVEFHGGTITCSSTEGKGTTFTVTLPSGV